MNSINDFFQFYKKILKENKDININEEMIFNSLININIPNDQLDIEIDSLFDEWKTKYINYDVTIKNDYIEMSKGNLEVTSKIKVFISLNYNHIYKNINKILNFLNDKSFIIRISKIIRNDNIIILFDNIENVKLLDKFIQDNINEGVLKPNPFTYIYNNIGLTIDGNISFCNTITRVIYEYLLSKKDNIDEIQEVDFYNFMIDKYNNEFINLSTYSNIKIPFVDNILYNEKSIVYYKNLIELLLKSSEEKFNIDKFEKHFKDSNNLDKLIKDKTTFNIYNSIILLKKLNTFDIPATLDKLYKFIETGNKKYITNKGSIRTYMLLNNFRQNIQNLLKEKNITLVDLYNSLKIYEDDIVTIDNSEISKNLKSIIKKMTELIDYKSAIDLIQIYIETNDISVITRENNIRKDIIDKDIRNLVLKLLIKENISFSEYVDNLEEYIIIEEEKPLFNYIENTNEDDDDFDLDTHLDITSIMISAIDDNKNDTIEEKTNNSDKSDILNNIDDILNEINNDEEDKTINLDENQIQDLIINNNDYEILFNDAIKETYNKYQQLYDDGKIKFDGFALVNYAITSILEKNDYSSFTRLNEARKSISLLSKQDILDIINNKLEIPKMKIEDINHEKIQILIREYLDKIL